jgi:uncharacterized protein YqgV (UPF0045/DUF77 family)
MLHTVNVALQVLPSSDEKHPYEIIDKAIEVIRTSGVRYKVCPFETVMEGDYDTLMSIVKTIQEECLEYGAKSMISNIKIQISRNEDLHFEDKIRKFDG